MAAGLVKLRSDGRIHVRSAGSDPGRADQPGCGRGHDRARRRHEPGVPQAADGRGRAAADAVITMGCGDACPIYPGKKYEDWELDDPAGQDVETVRRIRDELDAARAEADRRAAPREQLRRLPSARALWSPRRSGRSRSSSPAAARSWSTKRPARSATSASRSRFGLVIMAMIYAVGHISGAHFNPAVTFSFALTRHFPWLHVRRTGRAQLAGALPRPRSCAARSETSPTSARPTRAAPRRRRFCGRPCSRSS